MSGQSGDSDMDSSDDCEYDYYSDLDVEQLNSKKPDPEYLEFVCLDMESVEKLLNETVEQLSNLINVTPYIAKVLLLEHKWKIDDIVKKYHLNKSTLMIHARINPQSQIFDNEGLSEFGMPCDNQINSHKSSQAKSIELKSNMSPGYWCSVCITFLPAECFYKLNCAHSFCALCWLTYIETQIEQGITISMGCMATKCNVRVPEELVLNLLTKPYIRDKYQQFAFLDYVKSHPSLRFCPGPNCKTIIKSIDTVPKKATCDACNTSFCYQCGIDYHAPTDCKIIRLWLTKCADDSETANYISAHTKDCPKCHICIEKNGGCNHMQCSNCKYDFCWMCIGDWKTHGSEYYECSRYKENPNIANESLHAQAREALKKYLHYYERWENHKKSLQLEQHTLDRLKCRINRKVMKCLGTWIDWQHLFIAASLLAKCRYTLQYTYPYAYFMETGSRKDLFEYQQAQLEAEIENLSWKLERAENIDRGDIENQMDVAEKRRISLITDFFLNAYDIK